MKFRNTLTAITVALLAGTVASAGESKTDSTFKCDNSSTGKCHYLLYSSSCKEASVVNGKQSLVCNFAFLQEFTLKVGQSKVLENLPAGYKACPVVPGKQQVFPACAK